MKRTDPMNSTTRKRLSWSVLVPLLALAAPAFAAGPPQPAEPVDEAPRRITMDVRAEPGRPHVLFIDGNGPLELQPFAARRGYLGVSLLDLTPELRAHFGAPEEAGVLVSRVEADSPAERDGVAVGDVVIELDGEAVATGGQIARRIGRREDGDRVVLRLVRDRVVQEIPVTVTENERQQLDLGEFLWRCQEGEEGCDGVGPAARSLRRVLEIDSEQLHETLARVNTELGSPEWRERARLFQGGYRQIEEKIQALEKRIRELEAQLAAPPGE